MNGFYVPGSIIGSYVANKRNIEGTPQYEAVSNEIAIQKQAALQNLGQNYSTTIENAYASYLANQRGINTSAMGQGYKEAYKEAQEESLIRNIAEANKTAATARMQLESEAAEAQSGLQAQYEADVARLDRVASSLNDYLTYVRSLSGSEDASVKYFTEEQEKQLDEGALTVDDLYRDLLGAQPKSFTDEEGQKGLSYREWIKSQMKDTEEDTAWFNWLAFQGGQEEFEAALSRQESLTLPQRLKTQKEQQELLEQQQALEAERKKFEDIEAGYVGTATKEHTGAFEASKYTIDGKTYKAISTVEAGSNMSAEISNALNIKNRLKTGDSKIGDIIRYKDKYYVIVAQQNGPGKNVIYHQINYTEPELTKSPELASTEINTYRKGISQLMGGYDTDKLLNYILIEGFGEAPKRSFKNETEKANYYKNIYNKLNKLSKSRKDYLLNYYRNVTGEK